MRFRYKIIILFICLVALFLYFRYLEYRRLVDARHLIQSSIGTLDKNAKQALVLLEGAKKTKEVHFNIARIIDLNMENTDAPEVMDNYFEVMDTTPTLFEIEQMEYFLRRQAGYNVPFNAALEESRQGYFEDAIEEAKENTTNKLDTFSHFAEHTISNTSDPQNTHDSSVNVQSRNVLDKLGDGSSDYIGDIERLVDDQPEEKRYRMTLALDKIKEDHYNSTFSSSEMAILNKVWERTQVKENVDNKQNLQDAILYSLYDMADKDGGTVCSSGRMTRLVDSLAFIDKEDIFNGYMTTEQIRNEIIQHSNDLLKETIDENLEYKTELENIAKSYTDPSTQFSEEDETLFKNIVKSKIVDDMQTFREKLSDQDYQKIQTFCLEAVDSI